MSLVEHLALTAYLIHKSKVLVLEGSGRDDVVDVTGCVPVRNSSALTVTDQPQRLTSGVSKNRNPPNSLPIYTKAPFTKVQSSVLLKGPVNPPPPPTNPPLLPLSVLPIKTPQTCPPSPFTPSSPSSSSPPTTKPASSPNTTPHPTPPPPTHRHRTLTRR